MKFGFDWPSGFGEEDVLALWTPDHAGNPISSPMSLRLRLANKVEYISKVITQFDG